MHHFRIRALATVAIAGLALAACGSSSKASTDTAPTTTTVAPDTTTTAAPDATTVAPAAAASVDLATTKFGKVLVDSKGQTLYRFDADTVAGKSACGAGQCATTWPAATVTGAATPGTGVTGALTTFTRDDGATQVEVAGHPLYTFSGDAKAGDANGQGILSKWYVVGADGNEIKTAA